MSFHKLIEVHKKLRLLEQIYRLLILSFFFMKSIHSLERIARWILNSIIWAKGHIKLILELYSFLSTFWWILTTVFFFDWAFNPRFLNLYMFISALNHACQVLL